MGKRFSCPALCALIRFFFLEALEVLEVVPGFFAYIFGMPANSAGALGTWKLEFSIWVSRLLFEGECLSSLGSRR